MYDCEWVRVSRSEPCPICERTTYCTRSADGSVVRCTRVESDHDSHSSLGYAWLHRLRDPLPERLPPPEPPKREDWTNDAVGYYSNKLAAITRFSLADSLGVAITSLRHLGVGYGKDFHGEFSTWPEMDPSRRVVGIIRRYPDGEKKTMFGASHGVYFSQDWDQLSGPTYIVEGGTDTAAMISAKVSAIGRPSNTGGVADLVGLLKGTSRDVYVVAERDRKPERIGGISSCPPDCKGCAWCWPGRFGAIEVAKKLSKELDREVGWFLPDLCAKDVRHWLNILGPKGLRAALGRKVREAAERQAAQGSRGDQ